MLEARAVVSERRGAALQQISTLQKKEGVFLWPGGTPAAGERPAREPRFAMRPLWHAPVSGSACLGPCPVLRLPLLPLPLLRRRCRCCCCGGTCASTSGAWMPGCLLPYYAAAGVTSHTRPTPPRTRSLQAPSPRCSTTAPLARCATPTVPSSCTSATTAGGSRCAHSRSMLRRRRPKGRGFGGLQGQLAGVARPPAWRRRVPPCRHACCACCALLCRLEGGAPAPAPP